MGKTGKISSIKREYNMNDVSFESSLSRNGYSRFPGTGVRFEVFKEPNGDYRTGLNEKASYLSKLDPETRKVEQARIIETRERLEELSGLDLGPRSDYYKDRNNPDREFKASLVRLKEGDNIFDLSDVWKAIDYEWLKVHPLIASSYSAYERGEYDPSVQFYVNDDNVEEEIKYKKKTLINKAIVTLDAMSLEKRKKVARLLGIPVTDNSKEHVVYNSLDSFIKNSTIVDGDYKGSNPVDLFNKFATMDEKLINVKDLVGLAIKHAIYRTKNGRITEGGQEIARDKDSLVEHLMLDKNQEDLIALQDKLNAKLSTRA